MLKKLAASVAVLFTTVSHLFGGPPFVTDDPVPVELGQWEVYLGTTLNHEAEGWEGALPLMEINYGPLPNLQLHLQVTNSFAAPLHQSTRAGFGDTELGFKYRFVQETTQLPQVSVYPTVEIPTGDQGRDLGSGHTDVFFPVWLQKSFGKWTAYGGGGYWFNPGADNQDWWLSGLLLQRKVTSHLELGAEVVHETAKVHDGTSNTFFNAGGVLDLSERSHLLFSAGHTIQGRSNFQAYLGWQFTFGPEKGESK